MKAYEFLFILKPTLTAEELEVGVETVLNYITNNGGEIAKTDEMGMRKLAYPINKNSRGYYVVVYFKAPTKAISEIERLARFNEDLLRFLTIKYESKKERLHWEKLASLSDKEEKESKKEEEVKTETEKESEPKTEE